MTAWIAFMLAIASGVATYLATGPTLGLFFSGIVFSALLIPPLCLGENRLIDRLLIAAAVCDGISLIWLIAVFASQITFVQWLLCYALLIAWSFALSGLSIGLNRLLLSSIPAAAIATFLALLWLSSSIWLARELPRHPSFVSWIIGPHPLFAANGVLRNLGIWTERPIAYRYLFTLGQDVPYELPRNILPTVAVHLLIGTAGLLWGRALGKR